MQPGRPHTGAERTSVNVYLEEDLVCERHIEESVAARTLRGLGLCDDAKPEVVNALLMARAALTALADDRVTAVTVRVRSGRHWAHIHAYK
jgi:hypothetical protein